MKSLIAATAIAVALMGTTASVAQAHPVGWHHHRHCTSWGWHHHHTRYCRGWGW